MPMYHRRRPSPIKVYRRQEPTPTITGAPEAEETQSPESPDSPFSSPSTIGGVSSAESSPEPTGLGGEAAEGEESDDEEEPELPEPSQSPQASSGAAIPAQTSQPQAAPAVPTVTATSSAAPQQAPSATSAVTAPPVSSSSTLSTRIVAAPQITNGVSSIDPDAALRGPISLGSSITDINLSNKNASPARPTSTPNPSGAPETIGSDGGVAQGNEPPQRTQNRGGMSHAAEAALITFTILGGIALLIGGFIFLKKRRRARENAFRHAENAFDPGNSGSLSKPETVHISSDNHMTRSTNATTSLFGAGHYERPETVSTDRGNAASRIPPTPNPFADPPLNKAYDVLRGRPRSTTLTDRGSWEKNPFQDPVSERFDPFGELQARARMERVRYMEELRQEEEELQRERGRLGVGTTIVPGRKGSGVTLEGVGVLDRSGEGRNFGR